LGCQTVGMAGLRRVPKAQLVGEQDPVGEAKTVAGASCRTPRK
jgi:hypothetical protein